MNIEVVKKYFKKFQNQFCKMIETEEDSFTFQKDPWKHKNGGGGETRVLENGSVIEKGGVNFSHVFGDQLPSVATSRRPELKGLSFQAIGISIVIHPKNPYAPTSHANLRYFSTQGQKGDPIWWFGGGFDLTPYYGFEEDCILWHQSAKEACTPFGETVHSRFKKWCDEYFYLKHRNEPRGIGGLFFDDLSEWGFEKCFDFVQAVGKNYLQAYQKILSKRKETPYTMRERNFQLYRRGRYVEFNLLYDRGTLFGLQSGKRTESILMSLPPIVHWNYDWKPKTDSPEAQLYSDFLEPKEWV